MSLHTITRHIVRLGDGRKVEVDNPPPMDNRGFRDGRNRLTGERVIYWRQQVIEAQEITVEVDRDGHRVDERTKA